MERIIMNTSPVMKLTAFTATYNGKHVQRFIMCEYIDDKAYISLEQLDKILSEEFGIVPRGVTFTIG
jgi:hypothetical protein